MDRHYICIPVDSSLDPSELRGAVLEDGLSSPETTIDSHAVRVDAEDPYARLSDAQGQVRILREALTSHGWTEQTLDTLLAVATPDEASSTRSAPVAPGAIVKASAAPKPVGAYPHARRVGELLYLSGVGPRQPGTDAVPGGMIDANGCSGKGSPEEEEALFLNKPLLSSLLRF